MCRALARFGVRAAVCRGIDELCRQLRQAGAAVIARVCLEPSGGRQSSGAERPKAVEQLAEAMAQLPQGADFPLVLLTPRSAAREQAGALPGAIEATANVIVLERPLRSVTLATAVRALLRARRRVVADITDRREAEEALHQSEERFRAVQELSLDAFSFLEAVRNDAGVIVDFSWRFVNSAAAQLLHRTRQELIGRRLFEVLSDKAHTQEVFQRCVQVVESGESYELEMQYESDCGPGWLRNAAVKLGDGVAVYYSDITERKRAEIALQQSEARFRGTFQNATVGLAHVGLDGRWLLVNPKLQDLVGYSEPELLAMRFQDITHPDDLDEQTRLFQSLVRGEIGQYAMENRYFHRDGQVVWGHVTAALQCDPSGNPWYLIAAVEDITQRKESERQLKELNETLEQRVAERTAVAEQRAALVRMLAGKLTRTEQRERRRLAQVLHDHLQQLLVAAKLKAGVLRRKATHPEAIRPLDQITDLLNQSIDASRSLTAELCPPILYDAGLISSLEWLAREMQDKHGLAVAVEADRQAEPAAEDTRVLLFQAVRELLFNVVKHAHADRAWVRVGHAEPDLVQVTVRDAGVGFAVEPADGNGISKCGFGLLSLRERLEWIDGRLELVSAPGRGTLATLSAPRAAAVPPPALTSSSGTRAAVASRQRWTQGAVAAGPADGRIRVVIAEDHELFREGLCGLLLTQQDLEVVGEAVDGQAAVELVLATCPDVVMMDMMMPRLNGVEATRRVLAELPSVRVIGLSMYHEEPMARAMREAGAVAFIPKDAPLETILATIRGKSPMEGEAAAETATDPSARVGQGAGRRNDSLGDLQESERS